MPILIGYPEDASMIDEMTHLRDAHALAELLSHYAGLAQPDRQVWHARLSPEGMQPRQAARLHGELIASGWIEQNTGVVTPGSYRVTRAGMVALEQMGIQRESTNVDS